MAVNTKVSFGVFAAFALICAIFLPAIQGQPLPAPAPAPASDGTAIDQGIAYGLMLLALVLTYLIHTFDAPLGV
ncbi:Arabinogalactan peptide 20 [Striga hermonthica]|uniref:Arabinogalactan peptide 20 n=1 Tax=Striga hermonthica TaxID=68872 RepID=A0A9N7RA86_STRHE|nr:Arabinogalactan peptide 20 [Striga hermonthica]